MLYLAGALAAANVAVIVLVAVLGWGGALSIAHRLGLSSLAAGIVWAAPARAVAGAVGPGDVLLFGGLLAYLLAAHGRRIFHTVDALDGAADGRIGRPRG
jgi:hypothetical protein